MKATSFRTLFSAIAPVLISAWALAGEPPTIDDFFTPTTVVGIEVDLDRFDLAAWGEIFTGAVGPLLDDDEAAAIKAEVARLTKEGDQWLAELRGAGAERLYAIGEAAPILGSPPVAFVVPLADGADRDRIRALLGALGQGEINSASSSVIWSPPGVLLQSMGANRPELLSALSGTGNAPVRIAAALPRYVGRALAEAIPALPAELGGGSTAASIDAALWLSVRASTTAEHPVILTVQCADADGATTLDHLARHSLRALLAQISSNELDANDIGAIAEHLSFTRDGDRLTLRLDRERMHALAKTAVPLLNRARASANQMKSMTNVRDLCMVIHLHASENDGALPRDLDYLAWAKYVEDDVLINPLRPKQKPGYVYVKPESLAGKHFHPDAVLIHGAFDEWPEEGVAVGFMDGHVEWIANRERFDELMAKTTGGQ